MWQMQFNIDKCFILRVGRPKHKLVHLYTLHNQHLSETDSAKYLALTITSDLQWNQHIKGALYRIWCGVNRLGDSGVKVV